MGFKNILNDLFSPDEQEEEAVEISEDEKESTASAEKAETAPKSAPASRTSASAFPKSSSSAGALELKICKPQSFSEVGTIADHLINRCTVVLNLETTTKETARRIVDFLNGVAYSIDGQIKPVANNTFVITPRSVSVTGEHLEDEPIIEETKQEDSSFDNF